MSITRKGLLYGLLASAAIVAGPAFAEVRLANPTEAGMSTDGLATLDKNFHGLVDAGAIGLQGDGRARHPLLDLRRDRVHRQRRDQGNGGESGQPAQPHTVRAIHAVHAVCDSVKAADEEAGAAVTVVDELCVDDLLPKAPRDLEEERLVAHDAGIFGRVELEELGPPGVREGHGEHAPRHLVLHARERDGVDDAGVGEQVGEVEVGPVAGDDRA